MKTKKCSNCRGKMVEKKDINPDGITYNYFHCTNCGEEILTMKQLHESAKKYRAMKKYYAKVARWGGATAMRFPKELAKKYALKIGKEIAFIPEKKAIRIIT